MEKNVSALKVFFCSLLGYVVLNVIRTILFDISTIIIYAIGIKLFRYALVCIAFFYTYCFGYFVSEKIGDKILKTEDALRRYNRNIGLLLIINYSYFIVDYFRYGEGNLYFFGASLVAGIGLFFVNLKKKGE